MSQQENEAVAMIKRKENQNQNSRREKRGLYDNKTFTTWTDTKEIRRFVARTFVGQLEISSEEPSLKT